MRLPETFYYNDDVVAVARQLLGKFLCTYIDGQFTSGMISETEAYRGAEDQASHAYKNRRTKRTEIMFQKGGVSYVYLCYGIHTLLNVVTNMEGIPHAVLIRALVPSDGIDCMRARRGKSSNKQLASGPGSAAQALGITLAHNGLSLQGSAIWIEDRGIIPTNIVAAPRIGIDYAGSHALLPWRFYTRSNL